ncbi:allantoicase-like [Mya arenaria]|uniref:allantoicase-like n=1 Tax=Mya arenaria TaxID=6604 RepID=UPI0022E98C13|nr:allantoicase-like [Mya arenaria]XP_052803533.1 allantoicase-like [Mya arenaria]
MATAVINQFGSTSASEPAFTAYNDLASTKVGGKVLFATDDWFAQAENLLKPEDAQFREGYYTECGKWMDGWETRRKHDEGYNWCIIQLGVPGEIEGLDIDTSYFTGNFAPRCSVQAAWLDNSYKGRDGDRLGTHATSEETTEIEKLHSEDWEFIVSLSELKPGFPKSSHNYFHCSGKKKYTHLRLNIYPDGGVARLRVYGQARRDWSKVSERKIVDLLSALNGGLCLQCSRSNGGGGRNLIQAGRGSSVEDGWVVTPLATRPSVVQFNRDGHMHNAGSEWCVFRLGHPGIVTMVEVDTNNFKGNFPDVCRVEACFLDNSANDLDTNIPKSKWRTLLPVTKLKAHNQHFFYQDQLEKNTGVVSHVRLTVMPDGGVSRFRIWGTKANRAIAKL